MKTFNEPILEVIRIESDVVTAEGELGGDLSAEMGI